MPPSRPAVFDEILACRGSLEYTVVDPDPVKRVADHREPTRARGPGMAEREQERRKKEGGKGGRVQRENAECGCVKKR